MMFHFTLDNGMIISFSREPDNKVWIRLFENKLAMEPISTCLESANDVKRMSDMMN